jgi:hypothetical protein
VLVESPPRFAPRKKKRYLPRASSRSKSFSLHFSPLSYLILQNLCSVSILQNGNSSAKPLSPGSNPGVAFVNLSTFPAPRAASSPKSRNSSLCQTSSNQVESTQEFSHKFSHSFSYDLEVRTKSLSNFCVVERGDIFQGTFSKSKFCVNLG